MTKLFVTVFSLSLALPLLAQDTTHTGTASAGSNELKDDNAKAS